MAFESLSVSMLLVQQTTAMRQSHLNYHWYTCKDNSCIWLWNTAVEHYVACLPFCTVLGGGVRSCQGWVGCHWHWWLGWAIMAHDVFLNVRIVCFVL